MVSASEPSVLASRSKSSTAVAPENRSDTSGQSSSVRPYIGGQAVIEGVMMRSPGSLAIAVRRADGSISIRERPVTKRANRWAKVPLARGMSMLVESLRLGSEALRFSADLYEKDLVAAEANAQAEGTKATAQGTAAKGPAKILSVFGAWLAQLTSADLPQPTTEDEGKRVPNTMAIMTIVAVLFMVALPQLLAFGASSLAHTPMDVRSPQFQLLTGFFKLAVVLGYLAIIRAVPEIKRVFQYHGAEHKAISTYEAHEDLTVENARAKTTLHPRCGTTFLVLTVLVSILVWTALGPLLPKFGGNRVVEQVAFFLMKLPFLPLLAGITYELQRATARFCTTGPLRVLLWPGFLVQKITTLEPDDTQLEIALASLKTTLWREQVGPEGSQPVDENEVLAFPSYAALVEASDLRKPVAAA